MVGNSVAATSCLPGAGRALGAHPYPFLWYLEQVDHDQHVVELTSLADLPAWLADR